MKKYLAALTGITLLLPSLASAAYNDVSLTTDAVFTVSGIEIDVSGSNATLETISVTDSGTLSIGMQHDSGVTIKAPNQNQMTITQPNGVTVTQTCSSSLSRADIAASASVTVTVTPSSSLCADSSGGGGPVVSSGGGGGTGGSSTPVYGATTTVPASTPAHSADTVTQLQQQMRSLLAQLASLKGKAATSSFMHDLKAGKTGSEVKALQVYLNAHGYTVASSGPGSPDNETMTFGAATKAALIRLQKAVGITPASGYFGKKTRAYIAAHP